MSDNEEREGESRGMGEEHAECDMGGSGDAAGDDRPNGILWGFVELMRSGAVAGQFPDRKKRRDGMTG